MSRVGEKIKEARLKNGISQKALAKKLGVAEKYVNEVELGRKVAQESFIERAAKVLNTDLNDISMVVTDEDLMKERNETKTTFSSVPTNNKKIKSETNELWTEAFSSVLKNVPICNYDLKETAGTKQLPVHSNKIEGYSQDKVLYIKIQDDEMSGFRILKDDIALAHLVKEISNNGIFLVEYKGEKKIRQIKTLGNSKILLVSNRGTLLTETMEIKQVNVIAKLERIEFKL